ncbi:hypothetical protein GCM10007053_10250 [Halioglobus pacificus]|uniref:Uncharacterized protein n=2 Tax=Parahalioglobus pacificus TaxID=930806 RepID=A0A918XF14_9GAMM|nr:hypothetical protein GCM10007053_10250 [Halioglobus pacificus]
MGACAPPTCFLSLAVFLWLDLALSAERDYFDQADLRSYHLFNWLRLSVPIDTSIKTYFIQNESCWLVSEEFQQWAFHRDLIAAFNVAMGAAIALSKYFHQSCPNTVRATDDLRADILSLRPPYDAAHVFRKQDVLRTVVTGDTELDESLVNHLARVSEPCSSTDQFFEEFFLPLTDMDYTSYEFTEQELLRQR